MHSRFFVSFPVLIASSHCWSIFHYMMFHTLFIHFPAEGHIGYFQFWTIINETTVNIEVQVFVCTEVCGSFESIPRSVTADSCSESSLTFMRNSKGLPKSLCICWEQIRVSVVSLPYQLWSSGFLVLFCFLAFSHSNKHAVVFHCLNLQFSKYIRELP